jgi:hypothetical protein
MPNTENAMRRLTYCALPDVYDLQDPECAFDAKLEPRDRTYLAESKSMDSKNIYLEQLEKRDITAIAQIDQFQTLYNKKLAEP